MCSSQKQRSDRKADALRRSHDFLLDISPAAVYLVDQTVLQRFLGGHEVVTLSVAADILIGLAGVRAEDLVQTLLGALPVQMVDTSHWIYCIVS